MDYQYWKNRWSENKIGFHSPTVSDILTENEALILNAGFSTVFVPLCGKTPDLIWFAQKGFRVIGVEFVELAVKQFFEEQNIQPEIELFKQFTIYRHGQIELWNGSIFDVPEELFQQVDFIYDHAAVVALPPDLRKNYLRLIHKMPVRHTVLMLYAFDYDQTQMAGPPFSVKKDEISPFLKKNGK